jgi:alkanesulfonate monooxygenase SsuD/methylene tetrahydromethanopterin reductase-like flavin-dependent oxidoreductase (luciferase family)
VQRYGARRQGRGRSRVRIRNSTDKRNSRPAHRLRRTARLRDDIIRYYARCLAQAGHTITPAHLSLGISTYVADSKAEAVRERGPYHLYFNRTLFSHGNFTETELQREAGYASAESTDYVSPENRRAVQFARADFRGMTMADVGRRAEQMPWGTADEVAERIIEQADSAGANMVQISLIEQIRLFARDVLPVLQAHEVARVPRAV